LTGAAGAITIRGGQPGDTPGAGWYRAWLMGRRKKREGEPQRTTSSGSLTRSSGATGVRRMRTKSCSSSSRSTRTSRSGGRSCWREPAGADLSGWRILTCARQRPLLAHARPAGSHVARPCDGRAGDACADRGPSCWTRRRRNHGLAAPVHRIRAAPRLRRSRSEGSRRRCGSAIAMLPGPSHQGTLTHSRRSCRGLPAQAGRQPRFVV
jgi:hypothetical protein